MKEQYRIEILDKKTKLKTIFYVEAQNIYMETYCRPNTFGYHDERTIRMINPRRADKNSKKGTRR